MQFAGTVAVEVVGISVGVVVAGRGDRERITFVSVFLSFEICIRHIRRFFENQLYSVYLPNMYVTYLPGLMTTFSAIF